MFINAFEPQAASLNLTPFKRHMQWPKMWEVWVRECIPIYTVTTSMILYWRHYLTATEKKRRRRRRKKQKKEKKETTVWNFVVLLFSHYFHLQANFIKMTNCTLQWAKKKKVWINPPFLKLQYIIWDLLVFHTSLICETSFHMVQLLTYLCLGEGLWLYQR